MKTAERIKSETWKDRKNLVLVYRPPGERKQARSAKTTHYRDAVTAANRWAVEIDEGITQARHILWDDFVDAYLERGIGGRSGTSTIKMAISIIGQAERFLNPKKPTDLDAIALSKLRAHWFNAHAESTATIWFQTSFSSDSAGVTRGKWGHRSSPRAWSFRAHS